VRGAGDDRYLSIEAHGFLSRFKLSLVDEHGVVEIGGGKVSFSVQ
jgi:hypothetical protein